MTNIKYAAKTQKNTLQSTSYLFSSLQVIQYMKRCFLSGLHEFKFLGLGSEGSDSL